MTASAPKLRKSTLALTVAAVLLTAANLRPAVIGVSPLLGQIRADLHLSAPAAGMLTTLPVLCFGLFAPMAPRIARRIGLERAISGALLVLLVGTLVRVLPGLMPLLVGTILAGASIGTINVLLPALIKQDFARRTGLMTGLYSMVLNLGAAAAAGLTIPLQKITGTTWELALGSWGLLAVLALLFWVPSLLKTQHLPPSIRTAATKVWRQPLAWAVTIFMGTQSLIFYTASAWLPEYLVANGYSITSAGALLAVFAISGTAASLIVPIIAARLTDQRWLAVAISAAACLGLVGLAVFPAGAWVWVVITGIGPGGAISLALLMIILRGSHAKQTASLSGMAQSIGYVLAAVGPILIGLTRDVTGSWTVAILVLAAFGIPQGISGFYSGRNRTLS